MKTAAFRISSGQDSRRSGRACDRGCAEGWLHPGGVDRCTGYLNIVKAERSAAAENRAAAR